LTVDDTLSSVAGRTSTIELKERLADTFNHGSSADVADDDKSCLWRTYPPLKPERGVENTLHAMNGKGPFIFGAAMGVDKAGIGDLIGSFDDLSVFGSNRARECYDLASVYQDFPALKIANLSIHRFDRGFTNECSHQAFPPQWCRISPI
jgi:hypothetical protein